MCGDQSDDECFYRRPHIFCKTQSKWKADNYELFSLTLKIIKAVCATKSIVYFRLKCTIYSPNTLPKYTKRENKKKLNEN